PGRGARLPLVVVCSHRQAPSGWPCRVRRTASADREAGPGSRAGSTPKTPPVPPSGGRAALTARQVQTPAPSPARGGGLGWGPLTPSAAVLITPPPRWRRPLPAPGIGNDLRYKNDSHLICSGRSAVPRASARNDPTTGSPSRDTPGVSSLATS